MYFILPRLNFHPIPFIMKLLNEKEPHTMKPPHTKPHPSRLWAAGIFMAASLGVLGAGYSLLLRDSAPGEGEYRSYEYHIAMIADEADTEFWEDVYKGAVEVGEQSGAYVERVGAGLTDHFPMEEAINMAVYENVDGILLCPADGEENKAMIDKACENGIPVITMQKDVPRSKRQGFVGINDFFLGREYGVRVLKLLEEGEGLVTVLVPGDSFNESSRNWFQEGLRTAVQTDKIRFDLRIIRDEQGLNNAEDVIQDMIQGRVEVPDLMICLDEVITQSTCQLIRDGRLPDGIRVIGSYLSDDILKAIQQGDLDSTITIDPVSMGRMSMEALMTYKKHHMVSYYTEVDTMLIDRAEAFRYRREKENGEKMELAQ